MRFKDLKDPEIKCGHTYTRWNEIRSCSSFFRRLININNYIIIFYTCIYCFLFFSIPMHIVFRSEYRLQIKRVLARHIDDFAVLQSKHTHHTRSIDSSVSIWIQTEEPLGEWPPSNWHFNVTRIKWAIVWEKVPLGHYRQYNQFKITQKRLTFTLCTLSLLNLYIVCTHKYNIIAISLPWQFLKITNGQKGEIHTEHVE